MHLPDGTLLQGGKYRIIRFISSGGFGCTYEAEHVMLQKRVAIKEFFVKDFCNRDERTAHVTVGTESKRALVDKLRGKFLDEARAICKLQHKGIVGVTDVFEENGTAYYAMDFIEGQSLADMLAANGTLPEDKAVKYIRQIAEALAYVHQNNRLHLDIKPGNIMVNQNDEAVLIDFGTSKQYDEVNGENTSTLTGRTPGYAPPEQMGNDVVKFTPSTDIYALGATLYKLVSGTTPLSSTRLVSGEEIAPLPAGISQGVRNAIEAAMQVNKWKRPQSIDDFLALLDGKAGKPEDSTTFDDDEPEVVVVTTPQGIKEEPKPKRKSPLVPISIAVACLVAIGIVVAVFLHRKPTPPDGELALADTVAADTVEPEEPEKKQEEEVVTPAATQETQTVQQSKPTTGTINGHEWVDLGLSVKWATCNVGASSPSDYGDYFAWGETSPKSSYDEDNCKTYNVSMGSIAGKSSYDAARANWGGTWRLPTASEIDELINKCKRTWTFIGGEAGDKVTGPNGNSIFLPAALFAVKASLAGCGGNYWSATPDESDTQRAYSLIFNSPDFYNPDFYRYSDSRDCGLSVRPVSE